MNNQQYAIHRRYDFLDWLKANHLGRNKSINAKNMKQWGNEREIRLIAHELRREGYPICSSFEGYFYAETRQDVKDTMGFIMGLHKLEAYEGLKLSLGRVE